MKETKKALQKSGNSIKNLSVFDLDYIPNIAREQNVNAALSNSFGLGGQNACLVIKRYQEKL